MQMQTYWNQTYVLPYSRADFTGLESPMVDDKVIPQPAFADALQAVEY